MAAVPVIDVGPLLSPEPEPRHLDEVAEALDAACRGVGFFTIVGHGIDSALLEQLDVASRAFFALPEHEKADIAMARAGRAWRGWFPLGGELTSGVPDGKEGIYFGTDLADDHPLVRAGTPLHGANLFPTRPPELRTSVIAYLDVMTELAQAVLGGLALGLGLDRQWFARTLTADPLVLFRIFRYPPVEPESESWGVAEHTDYGLLTVLGQDSHGGLQVRAPNGWIDVEPVPGSFVCNLGDMLERLTGGRYRSTPHRVRNIGHGDRLSFAFFLDPSWSATVEKLPIVDRPTDPAAADRWDHADVHGFVGSYGDYILGKVSKVFPDLSET